MNTRNFIKAPVLAFITILLLVMLFCKPKSKGTFEPYVPEEDPQTCVCMDSLRLSGGD